VTLVAHQPEYLPYLGFFAKISLADQLLLSDHVQFAVKDFQNRNRVLQNGRPVMLTVPVRTAGLAEQAIRDVRIDTRVPWGRKHMTTLRHAYGQSAHFARYAPRLEEIYGAGWERLCDLNTTLIRQICEWLEIRVPMRFTSELGFAQRKTLLLVEMCQRTGADTFVSGAGAAAYVEPERFAEHGLSHLFFRFAHPEYPQPGGVFVPNLSALDLLFSRGPESADVLRAAAAASMLSPEVPT
jgi:WbqC-like protein